MNKVIWRNNIRRGGGRCWAGGGGGLMNLLTLPFILLFSNFVNIIYNVPFLQLHLTISFYFSKYMYIYICIRVLHWPSRKRSKKGRTFDIPVLIWKHTEKNGKFNILLITYACKTVSYTVMWINIFINIIKNVIHFRWIN